MNRIPEPATLNLRHEELIIERTALNVRNKLKQLETCSIETRSMKREALKRAALKRED